MLVTRVERIETVAAAADGRLRPCVFDLEATVEGPVDPASGMVVNLAEMKGVLRREITAGLAGEVLDGRDGRAAAPTPERLARLVWDRLHGEVSGRRLRRIRLIGRPSPTVEHYGESEMDVTRIYEFSASHRLHSPHLADEENERLFGKCNNPAGHGHNYVLEVTVRGEPGADGEVLPAAALDRIVADRVVDRWDHRNLNVDVPEFRDVNPTAEEIARTAWNRLRADVESVRDGVRLRRVKLRETERNHVEYEGEEAQ
ncbi:MAG TPA: 6-carboxytetrahydropterin synthase [bacterium]|nr:6-carboxytetrahydropterin synthase [bacterium]